MKAEEQAYEYWLASLQELSSYKKKKIMEKIRSAKDLYYIEETALNRMDFLTKEDIEYMLTARKTHDFEREWEEAQKKGIWMKVCTDDAYPAKLKNVTGHPYALFGKGSLPDENSVSVAMVGARKCTRYGEKYAALFAETLALAGVQVISGLARGIDGAAQRGALIGEGRTYAVLGCGVDVCYPKENIGLYMDILEHGGGILSEFPPGASPLPYHFPQRNRIISGLSDLVLIMEAKEKSGSLITADFALEQGRDVWALPGPINSELSKGCNALIRQGAGILTSPEMLLEDLNLTYVHFQEKEVEKKKVLETDEDMVYSSVGLYPKGVEQLIEETGLSATELMRLLVGLEIKGFIKEVSKNHYVRS